MVRHHDPAGVGSCDRASSHRWRDVAQMTDRSIIDSLRVPSGEKPAIQAGPIYAYGGH